MEMTFQQSSYPRNTWEGKAPDSPMQHLDLASISRQLTSRASAPPSPRYLARDAFDIVAGKQQMYGNALHGEWSALCLSLPFDASSNRQKPLDLAIDGRSRLTSSLLVASQPGNSGIKERTSCCYLAVNSY